MALSKEDKRDVAEIVAAVVSGVLEAQRTQAPPLPIDASDPRSVLQQWRKGGARHDVRQVAGMLSLIDGSHASYAGTGGVLATVPAELEVDFTKHPSGVITNVLCAFDAAVAHYDAEFRRLKTDAYRAAGDSPEHLAELEKQRIRYVQANNYFRCRAHLLNSLVAKTLDSEDVKLIFKQGEAPPAAEVAAE
jgi:hypothetical protein